MIPFYSTELMLSCSEGAVAGRLTIDCMASNELASVSCSFDGGATETCSFPLELGIGRFGTDDHTLLLTVEDVFGQTLRREFGFRLTERKFFN